MIEMLAAELQPVARLRPAQGHAVVAAAGALAIAGVALFLGLRADVRALAPLPILVIRSGLLLLLGAAAAAAVIASARPTIGPRPHGWRWALAAALLVPLTSVALSLRAGALPPDLFYTRSGSVCLAASLAGAALVGTALVAWLRRGAVTDARRAGWLVGLAAGALGTFAYNLACLSSSIHYAAIWYGLAVALSAVVGRLVAPRLLRW
jgi:hypothetical protein